MRDLFHHVPPRSRIVPALILAIPLVLAGCGENTPDVPEGMHFQRVTGTVNLGNGTPLSQGKIVLTPVDGSTEPMSGWLDSDGIFTLMEGKGLTIAHGEFLVHFEPPKIPTDAGITPKAQAIIAKLQKSMQQIPAKYQKSASSGLKVTIGPETRELKTIVLK